MRRITGNLTKELKNHVGTLPVAQADALDVQSFRELVEHVARLSYRNGDHLLFFRGQSGDFRNKAGASTIYPNLYRGRRVTRDELKLRVDKLDSASSRLRVLFKKAGLQGHRDVRRRRYVQWSILQHYEVCDTPLLDLTQSLRVACSFAFLSGSEEPYVLVFGLPYVMNRISFNSEHELVTVRLLSICPPEALRPYFQEGYLAGTDEALMDFDSKSELDFNNRLIAKFRLGPRREFWRDGFRPYSKAVLYPKNDRIQDLCEDLEADLRTDASAGRVGEFLLQWVSLESRLLEVARSLAPERRTYSMLQALELLQARDTMGPELLEALHNLRRSRNTIVHFPERAGATKVSEATSKARMLQDKIRSAPPWDM